MKQLLIDFYDKHPFGFGVLGVSSGLSASAISLLQQLDLIIRVAGGFVALLVGIMVLILQGHKVACLVKKWLGIPAIILGMAALSITGCATRPGPVPSTIALKSSIDTAAGSTRKAAQSAASASESLRVAASKSKALLAAARPEERPAVAELQTALESAQTEIESTQVQLASANGALADSSGQLEGLHNQIAGMADALSKAREESDKEKAARDFWRACTWKLGLLSLALGLWIFRKPILLAAGL